MDIEIPLTRQEKYNRKIIQKRQKKRCAHDKRRKFERNYKELGFKIKCCDNEKNLNLSNLRIIDLSYFFDDYKIDGKLLNWKFDSIKNKPFICEFINKEKYIETGDTREIYSSFNFGSFEYYNVKLNISNEEFEYFFKYIENKKNGYQLEEKNLI
jgi:hypothetical protein